MRTYTLPLIAALLFSLFPAPAWGAGILTMKDSIAGLGLEVEIAGVPVSERVDLVIVPPSGNYLAFPVTLNANGGALFHVPGESARTAGTYRAFLGKNGERLSEQASCEVLPDSVDPIRSVVTVEPSRITADGRDSATVSVLLRDRYANALAGRPVDLLSARSGVSISANAKATDQQGVIRFTVATDLPGTVTLHAVDLLSDTTLATEATILAEDGSGTTAKTSSYVSPFAANLTDTALAAERTFGVIAGFEVTVSPKTLQANEMGNLTIRAIDKNGVTVEDYVGTVDIYAPNDSSAVLPGISDIAGHGEVNFAAKNLGQKFLPLSLSFKKGGAQTLRVEDKTDPANVLSGVTSVTVTGGTSSSSGGTLRITSPKADATIKGKSVTVTGTGPAYANVVITGGTEKATGETDENGDFSITVALDTSYNEYTLHVTDDAGDDRTIHLVRDSDPPAIVSATFSPEKPQEGANVLFVVESEPGLPDVRLKLNDESSILEEQKSKPGVYQVLLEAPRAGTYQPTVTAKDAAGNASQLLVSLTVTSKTLPTVQNLQAKAGAMSVNLSWDPVVSDEPAEKYRVYIAEDGTDFAHSLDTPDASKSLATVTGLKPGTTYSFAVTAVRGEIESEKSEIVTARPLGVTLTATPDAGSIFLEWSLSSPITFRSFLVEYGVDPAALTEQRVIPGGDIAADEKRSVTLRDLLPAVPYYIRVTPIATTGNPIKELVATAQATTPADGEVHYAASEQLPAFDDTTAPATPTPPSNAGSGAALPSLAWWLAGGAMAVVALFQWHRRRTLRLTNDFLRAMEARYHR